MFSLFFVGPQGRGGYAWSHAPSRGWVSLVPVSFWGLPGGGSGYTMMGGVNHGEGVNIPSKPTTVLTYSDGH